MDEDAALGRTIHMMRTRRKLTRQELVDRAQDLGSGSGDTGLSASSLNRLEKGQRSPRFAELEAICQATDVSLEEFVATYKSFLHESEGRILPTRPAPTPASRAQLPARVRALLADFEVELNVDQAQLHLHLHLPADWPEEV